MFAYAMVNYASALTFSHTSEQYTPCRCPKFRTKVTISYHMTKQYNCFYPISVGDICLFVLKH